MDRSSQNGELVAVGRNSPHWTDTRARYLDSLGIGIDFIRREIVAKDPENHESVSISRPSNARSGHEKTLHANGVHSVDRSRRSRIALDRVDREEPHRNSRRERASVLGVLRHGWGLLKIDTATKGYYTKRLFIGVPISDNRSCIAVVVRPATSNVLNRLVNA